MRDRDVVASVVAGDPAGLAAAYDSYAPQLFAFCRSMLREPADAADAVQDTFVIAASRLGDLREPDRLRPWLYAVARNVCLRKIRAERAAAASYPVAPSTESGAEVGRDAERAELRALVRSASGGLSPRDREILTLRLWQGLDVVEAAQVLGVSRSYANSLFARARAQLEVCVGVLLVARSGRKDCPALDAVLRRWDGQLTVLLRKRLSRHIEQCDICSDRRRRELAPALLGLSPGAAIAGAAAAEAALHAASAPAGLRHEALTAAAAHAGPPAAGSVQAGSQAGPFGRSGFPKPAQGGRAQLARTAVKVATGAGAVAAGVTLALALSGGGPHGRLALQGPGGTVAPGQPGASSHRGARPPGASPGAGALPPGRTPRPTAGSAAPPSSLATETARAGATPTASSSSSSSSSGAPQPSSPSSSAPGQPAQGTLAVSPTSLVLTPLLGSTITLTAENGPVSWSVTEPASLLGELVVSPASGTLAAGQSVQVTVSVSGLASLDSDLTVNPGGQQVQVLLGLGL